MLYIYGKILILHYPYNVYSLLLWDALMITNEK